MTDLKFSILEKLYHAERRQMLRNDLINTYKEDHLINEAQHALMELDEDKLINAPLKSDVAKLTKLGRVTLESVKEERQYQLECKQRELDAEQRALKSDELARESIRQTKLANAVAIGSIFVSLLSIAVAVFQIIQSFLK